MPKPLVIKSIAGVFLSLSPFLHSSAIAQSTNYSLISQNNVVQQTQEDYINIRVADLSKVNTLTIAKINNLNEGNLTGEIKINGQKIQDLKGNETNINLSPQLKKGINRVEVIGQYNPVSSSVKIEFSGSSTSISQVTSGGDALNYNLVISVE
jgi:hypothetical protein